MTQSSATHMTIMCSSEVEVNSFTWRPALEQGFVDERRRGGRRGVGEMEMHAAEASGLYAIQESLRSRTDVVIALVCTACCRQSALCVCNTPEYHRETLIPRSTLREDIAGFITQGVCYEFLTK